MVREGRFGVSEAVSLTCITICAKIFYTSPGYLSRLVGTTGWMTTLVSTLTSLAAFSVVLFLFSRYPGKNIIEIFFLTLGPFFGALFSLAFSAAFLVSAGIMIREFSDVMKIYVLLNTPISLVVVVFIIGVVVVSMLGLETLVRFARLSVYVILAAFLLVLLLGLENYRFANIAPFFGYGAGPTLLQGAARSSFYDSVMILTVFSGSLQGTKFLRKAGYRSLVIAGAITSLGLLCFSLTFPVSTLQELTDPMLELARTIHYGSFFQRMEPIFIFIWVVSSLIATTALFYASVSSYSKTFRIQDTKPVILPMSVCLFISAMAPDNFNTVVSSAVQTSREFGWAVFFGLPFICLLVHAYRRLSGT